MNETIWWITLGVDLTLFHSIGPRKAKPNEKSILKYGKKQEENLNVFVEKGSTDCIAEMKLAGRMLEEHNGVFRLLWSRQVYIHIHSFIFEDTRCGYPNDTQNHFRIIGGKFIFIFSYNVLWSNSEYIRNIYWGTVGIY